MATNVGYLTVSLAGSSSNIISAGLQVSQPVDADMISGVGILFDVKGDDLGWYYDSSTDIVSIVTEDGFQVALVRKGDYWQWVVTPEDLGGAQTEPGETRTVSAEIVVERNASGVRTRLVSRDFSIVLERQFGFNPMSISGLVAWYDAYSLSALSAGDAVATWEDKTLYGRDLTEATNRPTKRLTAASRPYVDFDGSNDLLTSTLADIGDACTLFVVGMLDSVDATTRGLVQVGGTNGARLAANSSNLKGLSGADVANTTLPTADVWFVGTVTKTSSGAITAQKGLAAAASQASTNAVTPGTVGLGDTAADSPFDGGISEILIYDSVLSAGNIERVVRHLRAKWNALG